MVQAARPTPSPHGDDLGRALVAVRVEEPGHVAVQEAAGVRGQAGPLPGAVLDPGLRGLRHLDGDPAHRSNVAEEYAPAARTRSTVPWPTVPRSRRRNEVYYTELTAGTVDTIATWRATPHKARGHAAQGADRTGDHAGGRAHDRHGRSRPTRRQFRDRRGRVAEYTGA